MADQHRPPTVRIALLLAGGMAVLAGLDAASILLRVPAPVGRDRLPEVYGILLVLGVAGTLVALRRAVSLGRPWGFTAPAGLGVGALLLLPALPRSAGGWAMVVGAAALVAVHVPLWHRRPVVAVLVQAGGAVLATGAALLWTGGVPVPWLLPWLAGFLVLTVVGEGLEPLAPRSELEVAALSAAVPVGVLAALLWPPVGYPLLGAAILGVAGWLLRRDVAGHPSRCTGLPRFGAACLLAGYGWLAAVGASWLLLGPLPDGGGYDAVLHAVLFGFAISTVMARAPGTLAALLRRPLPYHRAMAVPAGLLHAALILRIVVGDVRGVGWAWTVGGVLIAVSVLLFGGVAAWSAVTAPLPAPPRAVRPPAGAGVR